MSDDAVKIDHQDLDPDMMLSLRAMMMQEQGRIMQALTRMDPPEQHRRAMLQYLGVLDLKYTIQKLAISGVSAAQMQPTIDVLIPGLIKELQDLDRAACDAYGGEPLFPEGAEGG